MYNTFLIDNETITQVLKLPITNGSKLLFIDILIQARKRDYFLLNDSVKTLNLNKRFMYKELELLKPYLKYKRVRKQYKNFYYIEELNI